MNCYFESLDLAFDAYNTLNKLLCCGDFTEEEIQTLRKEKSTLLEKEHTKTNVKGGIEMSNKTVVFDFDGVIHSYTSGWRGETNIPDPPVEGIREAIKEIRDAGYKVVVVSTRTKEIEGFEAVALWLMKNDIKVDSIKNYKPPAIAYIDDRAICFDGHPETLLDKINNFKTWYERRNSYVR